MYQKAYSLLFMKSIVKIQSFAHQIIKFILLLANTNPAVADYLGKQKKEMMWIEQLLEARVGAPERPNPLVGSDNEIDDDALEPGEHEMPEASSKRDSIKLTHLAVKKFLAECGIEDEPNYDKERELMEEIQELRDENSKLKEALEYFRAKAPEVKPPPFMTTRDWLEKRSTALKVEEDDEETEEDDGLHTTSMEEPSPMEMENMSANTEAVEKAKQIIEIFTNVSMAAAMIALKKCDYDLDAACCQLADGATLSEILKEAEGDATHGSPIMKRQKQLPAAPTVDDIEVGTKTDNKVINGKRSLSQ